MADLGRTWVPSTGLSNQIANTRLTQILYLDLGDMPTGSSPQFEAAPEAELNAKMLASALCSQFGIRCSREVDHQLCFCYSRH